jgi:hypothetical protein
MVNIPEIDLKMDSKKVGEYNIDDMIQMFGDRIKPAIIKKLLIDSGNYKL